MNNKNQIDFVLTWVNGNDPEWRKSMEYYKKCAGENQNGTNSSSENRYRDWNLLRYWFRGVEKFAPWVHRIYFVTCGQKPDWLNTEHPKLVLVDHKDFIPEQYLPTFNSSTIIIRIGKIPGISEQFVNFNDDMFLIAPVKPEDFFIEGKACESALLSVISPEKAWDIFPHILVNNLGIINQYFKKKEVLKKQRRMFYSLKYGKNILKNLYLTPSAFFNGFKDTHLPSSYLRSTWNEVWKAEGKRFDKAAENKFRAESDYNEWLMKNWQICSGKSVPRSTSWGKCYQLGMDTGVAVDIRSQKYKAICINDSYPDLFDFESVHKEMEDAFMEILPDSCSFERSSN